MKFTFEIGVLAFTVAFMLIAATQASAQQQSVPLIPSLQNHTQQARQAHLFGVTNSFTVNVVCANGQLAHKSATVQSGQPAATINVNCGSSGSGSGSGTGQQPIPGPQGPKGEQGPPGPAGPPATICILTPLNNCNSGASNATALASK